MKSNIIHFAIILLLVFLSRIIITPSTLLSIDSGILSFLFSGIVGGTKVVLIGSIYFLILNTIIARRSRKKHGKDIQQILEELNNSIE